MLALQFQLETSQWYSPGRLQALQLRQLAALLDHAYTTVPYYRRRWQGAYRPGEAITPGRFHALPVLTRTDLQASFESMCSNRIPAGHGGITELRTSGSTGQPVRILKTGLTELLWQAAVLRELHWSGRDPLGKLAVIRQGVQEAEADGWGPVMGPFRSGRAVSLSVRTDVETQLRWLERQQPRYLITYPSNADALARAALANGTRLPGLCEVQTMGELLRPGTRELCREAWGVPIVDVYSSVEAGYIGLQCPSHEHYHVQAESVIVEILDDGGKPCVPGELGRVVVTTLHNFALPLVRYDIGDYAEAGAECPCGRGLPVLRRIVGRARNMLVAPDGRRYWPALGSREIALIAPVLQYQLAQTAPALIEVRLVTAATLTVDQEAAVRRLILSRLPAGFRLELAYRDHIPRGAGGKFEDFVSESGALAR